jgi:hypothetical protein
MPEVHTIQLDGDAWYRVSDLVNWIGYTPYALKWPENTLEIKKTLNETSVYDPVEYIQKKEFLTWLEWKVVYERDDKSVSLYKELTGLDAPTESE